MPEGDTLQRLAIAMSSWLEGERVERIELERVELPALRGLVVDSVHAVGKHLLIAVGGFYLRAHLGLAGSWHRYPAGVVWKRPAWQASMLLSTGRQTFVCFHAREVDCIKACRLPLHRALRRLGPDLLAPDVDLSEISRRVRARAPRSAIADILLDQSVASGVGNVYKSEVLFITGVPPWVAIGNLTDAEVLSIYREARAQMQANVRRAHRMTTGSSTHRLWVYGRAGRACLCCPSRISFKRMGGDASRRGRVTYLCPACQPQDRIDHNEASPGAADRRRRAAPAARP